MKRCSRASLLEMLVSHCEPRVRACVVFNSLRCLLLTMRPLQDGRLAACSVILLRQSLIFVVHPLCCGCCCCRTVGIRSWRCEESLPCEKRTAGTSPTLTQRIQCFCTRSASYHHRLIDRLMMRACAPRVSRLCMWPCRFAQRHTDSRELCQLFFSLAQANNFSLSRANFHVQHATRFKERHYARVLRAVC